MSVDPAFAPKETFRQAVRYFPLPSVNIVLQNAQGECLFLRRKNNPAKGEWWIPGGRLLNGETVRDGAARVLRQETGLTLPILAISPEYSEELWDTEGFDADDWKIYDRATRCVHYLATVAHARLDREQTIALDAQSSDVRWLKDLPCEHSYLRRYFEMLGRAGVALAC